MTNTPMLREGADMTMHVDADLSTSRNALLTAGAIMIGAAFVNLRGIQRRRDGRIVYRGVNPVRRLILVAFGTFLLIMGVGIED